MSRISTRLAVVVGASALAIVAPLTVAATSPAIASSSTGSAAIPGLPTHFGSPLLKTGPNEISNWGGYVAHGSTFTSAKATWKVVKVTCLNDNDLYAPWVGIDGDGDSTVEQTGVATDCYTGVPRYEAWYEMYPQPPVYYSDPVSLGDVFNASVTVKGSDFTLTLKDVTQGWTESVTKSLSGAQKLCAEAVIEGPGGYPAITKVPFRNVVFNGKPLKSYKGNLTAYETQSGSATIYGPTKIKHKKNFKMKPVSSLLP